MPDALPSSEITELQTTAQVRARVAQGDPDAFDQLVEPLVDDLYTFCLRITGRDEDAADLAQDALIRARAKATTFDPRRPLRPWLLTIARNLWRSRLRSPWHRLRQVLQSFTADPDPAPDPEARSGGADSDRKVRAVLATLPPIYREAVSLFHLQDMTYAEMAQITSVSVAALKQRVRRGDAALANRIAELYPELVPGRRGG